MSADRQCPVELTTGRCALDADHRGRHSTVAFYCESCGKTRRGQPFRTSSTSDETFAFCFMCVEVEYAESSVC